MLCADVWSGYIAVVWCNIPFCTDHNHCWCSTKSMLSCRWLCFENCWSISDRYLLVDTYTYLCILMYICTWRAIIMGPPSCDFYTEICKNIVEIILLCSLYPAVTASAWYLVQIFRLLTYIGVIHQFYYVMQVYVKFTMNIKLLLYLTCHTLDNILTKIS